MIREQLIVFESRPDESRQWRLFESRADALRYAGGNTAHIVSRTVTRDTGKPYQRPQKQRRKTTKRV